MLLHTALLAASALGGCDGDALEEPGAAGNSTAVHHPTEPRVTPGAQQQAANGPAPTGTGAAARPAAPAQAGADSAAGEAQDGRRGTGGGNGHGGPAAGDAAPGALAFEPPPADDPLFTRGAEGPRRVVDAIANGGFELIADGTTEPPKFGAYWVGAFSRTEGDPSDLVGHGAAPQGERLLELPPGAAVHQKLVADPRWADELRVSLLVHAPDDAGAGATLLDVALEDGPGAITRVRLTPAFDGPAIAQHAALPDGWHRVELALGARFAHEHGRKPLPRLRLHLSAPAGSPAPARVDDVSALLPWPAVTEAELRATIAELIRWQLVLWFEPRERGGLGLVDPDTGYVRAVAYDVGTGAVTTPARWVFFHTIHNLLVEWLRHAHANDLRDEIDRWTPHLRRIVATLLERNFDPDTALPHTFNLKTSAPHLSPVTVASYVEFLLDARPLLGDDALAEAALAQARRTADALVALQRAHDLPPDEVENTWGLADDGLELVGDFPNWHGHMPERLDATGALDPPRRFNTSWAIVTGRPFWYHVFKSPAAVMEVHAQRPAEHDLDAVHRVVSLYHRDWDAARYDLENDTDDHYGYLCEDVLRILEHSGGALPDALALVQEATDHRLSRDADDAGDTLWIQAVRLGTACAGDSPRAFAGVLALHELPPAVNPVSSRLPLYRDAILELAANDLRGRQLTNAQFTESFFELWEMVCICFRGNEQGDCRGRPADYWHGDVGDTFGGPPTTAIEAQGYAWRVADEARRADILSALGIIHHVTETTMRRRHGYLFGLDARIARQYELPEKYTIGLDAHSTASLGYVMAWAKLLPFLEGDG